MVVMVVIPDRFTLCGLEQRHLWWHQPAQEEPEPELVAEWQDQLPLPVQTPGVTVVVLSCWNVLHKLTLLECCLSMLVKPRLEPP
ncbi:Os10g0397433, partial [Oryza sativa Japonica Group]